MNLKLEQKGIKLRGKVICCLKKQGFDVEGEQIDIDFGGIWFHGKFYSNDDLDARKWGYPDRPEKKQ